MLGQVLFLVPAVLTCVFGLTRSRDNLPDSIWRSGPVQQDHLLRWDNGAICVCNIIAWPSQWLVMRLCCQRQPSRPPYILLGRFLLGHFDQLSFPIPDNRKYKVFFFCLVEQKNTTILRATSRNVLEWKHLSNLNQNISCGYSDIMTLIKFYLVQM